MTASISIYKTKEPTPMNTLNPYGTEIQPTANSTALAVGQSLSRVRWHLVQSIFLKDRLLLPIKKKIKETVTARQHTGLWHSATLSVRARLEFGRELIPDPGRSDLDAAIDAIEAKERSPGLADELADANIESLKYEYNDSASEFPSVQERIVNDWLVPLLDDLQVAACSRLSTQSLVWLKLGRILDEGLCRPDLARFLNSSEHRDVLRVDPSTTLAFQRIEEFKDNKNYSIDSEQPVRQSIEQALGFASRRPGDLAPRDSWEVSVRQLWRRAKVPLEHLTPLEELQNIVRRRSAEALIDCVNRLNHAALSAASDGPPHFHVDLEHNRVELGTHIYEQLDNQVMCLFHDLKCHIGRANKTTFNSLRQSNHGLFGKHDKLKDVLNGAPAELRAIVKAQRGSGVWMELP